VLDEHTLKMQRRIDILLWLCNGYLTWYGVLPMLLFVWFQGDVSNYILSCVVYCFCEPTYKSPQANAPLLWNQESLGWRLSVIYPCRLYVWLCRDSHEHWRGKINQTLQTYNQHVINLTGALGFVLFLFGLPPDYWAFPVLSSGAVSLTLAVMGALIVALRLFLVMTAALTGSQVFERLIPWLTAVAVARFSRARSYTYGAAA
jgi:hypothetical protein